VWIRFLANQLPYAAELDRLLGLDELAAHDLVYGELLIGDRGGRRSLLAEYERIQRATTISHREVIDFVRTRHLHGRGAGWLDVQLLASAIVGRMQLWTADRPLATLADEPGVAYQPSGSNREWLS